MKDRKPRIWKISHGSQEFDGDPELRSFLEQHHLVTMNRWTPKGQGQCFEKEVKKGDLFFLREKGFIKLLGRIDQDGFSIPEEVNARFGAEDDWIAKKYTVICNACLHEKYNRVPRRGWTPNYNSTLAEVEAHELNEFENWILKPYFGISLASLPEFKGFSPTSVSHKTPSTQMTNRNTILYGPPGTSKTYNTADYAVAIIEGKSVEDIQLESHDAVHKRFLGYKEQKLIAFTTFHQSYGYEDFIEGIRPVLDNESEETSEVRYELHDGIFKEFCKRAAEANAVEREDYGIRPGASVWKVSLEGTGQNKTRSDCLKNGYIRIGWDEYGPDITDETFKNSASGKTVLKTFIDRMQIGDVVVSCWSANETDAIGVVTGDYEWHDEFAEYKRLRKVKWLWVAKDEKENIRKINHDCGMVLSTVYRLKIDLPDILSLVHKHRTKNAPLQNDASPRVFVIDEINRGNISKIFGELITLVEPSKRIGADEETKAKLPYSGDEFGVPSNVYILGTMNTADRSIALLDTALRRRFEFVEMMPKPQLLADIHVGDTGIDLEKLLRTMNDRIEFLLDREHTIGHAYFLGDFKDHPTLAGLADIFRNKIVPLLQEYFFDDYSKIRLVLGDNGTKVSDIQFFTEKKADGVFFGNAEDAVDPERCVYRINKEAFGNPAAYIGIYDDGKTT